MSLQPQPGSTFKPCPECGGRRVAVEDYIGNYNNPIFGMFLMPIRPSASRFAWSLKKFKKSETLTLACLQCGYTAWYALEPLNLLPDEK